MEFGKIGEVGVSGIITSIVLRSAGVSRYLGSMRDLLVDVAFILKGEAL
jgi:hypothetical protein